MARVVVTQPLPGDALDVLRAAHDVEVIGDGSPLEVGRVHAAMTQADALLCLLTDPIPRAAIAAAAAAGRLRVIANCAVGVDNIDVAAAREHDIIVCNTPNVLTEASADFALALLLAAARRVTEADRYVRAGRFDQWGIQLLLGRPLSGQLLGIVGLGRIGTAVARRARGFGLAIAYAGRRRADPSVEAELEARHLPLDDLLRQSDFVSLHVPLTGDTRHLIDARRLALMKPSAVLVNTARGPIVDEAALADALEARRLFAAGLDVFEREPEVHVKLLALDSVVLAPHIASATEPTRAAMARAVADDIVRVLAGHAPHSAVDH